MGALLLFGAFLRFFPSSGYPLIGYDERLYVRYVEQLGKYGPAAYPDIVEAYTTLQRSRPEAMLPPTRALFLLGGWSWRAMFGGTAFDALRHVSALAGVGAMLVAAGFGARLGGRAWALAATALMAVAPLQVHLAQRALIDGFFAFWAVLALWALYECLQRPPAQPGKWLAVYGVALVGLGLTKESALFVYAPLLGLLLLNPYARFGRAGRPVWVVTLAAPALAVGLLIVLCGGWEPLRAAFLAFRYQPPAPTPHGPNYVYLTGGGPWHRYLLDWTILCPGVTFLAVAGLMRGRARGDLGPEDTRGRILLFLGAFVVATYLELHLVLGGMNLRHTTIWDLPLRLLALGQLVPWARRFGARRDLVLALGVLILCALDLWTYHRMFVEAGIYDPVPEPMLRALEVLRR